MNCTFSSTKATKSVRREGLAHVCRRLLLRLALEKPRKSYGKCDIRCRFRWGCSRSCGLPLFGGSTKTATCDSSVLQQKRCPPPPTSSPANLLLTRYLLLGLRHQLFSEHRRSNVSSTFFLLSDLTTSTNLVFN